MYEITLKTDAPHRRGNLAALTGWSADLAHQRRIARIKRAATDSTWTPLRLGVDLDGVNYPFDETYGRYLVSQGFDPNRVTPATHWEFFKDYGQTVQEFLATCRAAVDAGFLFIEGEPLPGTIDAWHAAVRAGHEIHLVTDRPFGTAPHASLNATVAWLDRVRLPYDTITISADKTIANVDVFIEDRLENYDAVDASGIPCYLTDRPWNAVPGDARRRIPSAVEFVDMVLDGTIETAATVRAKAA